MAKSIVFENRLLKNRSLMQRLLGTASLNNLIFQSWVLKNRLFPAKRHPSREEYMTQQEEVFQERYEEKLDIWSDMPADRELASWFFDQLPEGDHHFLDIGTGRARDVEEFLRRRGGHGEGIDLVELENWGELRERWGERITLTSGSFLDYQPSKPFTAVSAVGVLGHQHPDDHAAFLARVREVLAPGGYFGLCAFHMKSEKTPGRLIYQDNRFWKFYSTNEIRELLEGAGFEWIDSYAQHHAFLPYLMTISRRKDA
ncbi:MAG: class I SAM-dependent methyltransferase [Kofleriaceae bacterium]